MIPSRIPHALRPLRLVSRSTLRSASSSATNTAALKPKAQPRRAAFSSSTPLRQKVAGEDRLPPSQLPGRKGTRDQQSAIPPAAEAADSAPAVFAPVPEPTSSAPLPSAPEIGNNGNGIDWSQSFHGLSTTPFSPETAAILMSPIDMQDVEVKPDGIIYLPEIKYRRILNQAFGPGGWGLAPRGEVTVSEKVVSREYALIVHGRYIAQARGECQYFSEETIPTASEGCKSNALLRCCKDLGIASELWDPRFIREFKKKHAREVWVEHVVNKKKRQIWIRKDGDPAYPYKLSK
ncbi:uncharacterized protein E0L32_004409 [Thyridium curvatum]|uniref:Mitochondrial genome maintenance protein MGM101 n=1 Tax=Thyridium curvatum TaxID=1093900 RepID=A0A507BDK3_9PEZI|nr:uncharacterized protein E0L32_004409 [Thyridium curvatum]TPX15429.1 hypothetical protein E0L32_004409 [Thyridium curvatum]